MNFWNFDANETLQQQLGSCQNINEITTSQLYNFSKSKKVIQKDSYYFPTEGANM